MRKFLYLLLALTIIACGAMMLQPGAVWGFSDLKHLVKQELVSHGIMKGAPAPAAPAPAKPAKVAATQPAAPAPAVPAAAKESGATYVVAKGDSPILIAKKLHVDYEALVKLNKITDPKKLQIGQKLQVPQKNS